MGLGKIEEKPKRQYLQLQEGRVVLNHNGKKEYYSYVEGTLSRIYQKERTFNGETVQYWYIDLQGEKGEIYSLSFPYRAGSFKSIILSLASSPSVALDKIKIEPYQKGGFTKVVVRANGNKLDWITDALPAVQEVTIGGKKVKDDSKRMNYIETLVERINALLK